MALAMHGLALTLVAAPAPDDEALGRFREQHRRAQLVGNGVLTGWAVANIAGGITGALVDPSDGRYIHEMNAMWNSVNLTLGILGLVNNRRLPKVRTMDEARRVNRRARRVYVINGAIDVVYVSAGMLVAGLGRKYDKPRVQGWGTAVVIQGAWLFVFDIAMAIAHSRVHANTVRVGPVVERSRVGIAVSGRF